MNIRAAVENFIQDAVSVTGGQFMLYDNLEQTPIVLFPQYDIEDNSLHTTGPGRYALAVDMNSSDGKDYNLDFFLEGPETGNAKVQEVLIRSVNGQPRYEWITPPAD
jgi:hypothetical protein